MRSNLLRAAAVLVALGAPVASASTAFADAYGYDRLTDAWPQIDAQHRELQMLGQSSPGIVVAGNPAQSLTDAGQDPSVAAPGPYDDRGDRSETRVQQLGGMY